MENLGFGLGISAVGMGLVFGLLGLLWLVLVLIGRLDAVLPGGGGAEASARPPAPAPASAAAGAEELEPDLLAAVSLAVALHARQSRREAAPAMRVTRPGSRIFASRWLAAGRTRQTRSFTPRR
jgi:Na+-transporting methylmalonyl-CoA/oxaloacetate decarboxylase gamma subunit